MNALTHPATLTLDTAAFELVRALSCALANAETCGQQALYHASQALCVHLLAHVGEPPMATPQRVALSPWQERLAKQTMLEHLGNGLSIAQVARTCSLSRSHFSRAFKQTTGLAPRDWLVQARLDKAKALLSESTASLSQISLDCGFADQSHFTRVFARATGKTPFTWRRSA
ncbi:MAG: AraC family transcriptional regulator [Pseudomonas sp.]|uniref:helix-turn-helix domain-containing protein n=1 Tax=Pseudomonas abieticivorans TaxID=2931382 RepID=UPI0020BF6BBB|nr:AraC family transcriptional regulator [Pseudomonas sp. PIA16]MDE1164888.1 AraC family transcriptional regulator [Pseudomonas sp.]